MRSRHRRRQRPRRHQRGSTPWTSSTPRTGTCCTPPSSRDGTRKPPPAVHRKVKCETRQRTFLGNVPGLPGHAACGGKEHTGRLRHGSENSPRRISTTHDESRRSRTSTALTTPLAEGLHSQATGHRQTVEQKVTTATKQETDPRSVGRKATTTTKTTSQQKTSKRKNGTYPLQQHGLNWQPRVRRIPQPHRLVHRGRDKICKLQCHSRSAATATARRWPWLGDVDHPLDAANW